VVAFEAADAFLAEFTAGQLACLILDYGLPGMNGLELQEHLKAQRVQIPIVFISGHGGVPESVRATKAGAIDFLEKPYKPEVLIDRIEEALALSREWIDATEHAANLQANLARLTDREREVFDLILTDPSAASSKALALALDISPRTADIHRSRVFEKVKCATVAELILYYK
jgi:FixJ family two-component response regulator